MSLTAIPGRSTFFESRFTRTITCTVPLPGSMTGLMNETRPLERASGKSGASTAGQPGTAGKAR